jgi:hypothetical protein
MLSSNFPFTFLGLHETELGPIINKHLPIFNTSLISLFAQREFVLSGKVEAVDSLKLLAVMTTNYSTSVIGDW